MTLKLMPVGKLNSQIGIGTLLYFISSSSRYNSTVTIVRSFSTPKDHVISRAVETLSSGGLVVYPTETTYGIGVDVENPEAVQRLLAYKGKRDNKPISVAVADQAMAQRYVVLNDTARKVYQTFLPGPVTVVSTGTGVAAAGIASAEGKVGIRIPKYDLALDLIRAFGRGITATSANASNKKRPYTVSDILDNISEKQKDLIDLIIDVGELPHNDPSTVIDTTLDDIVILRQGASAFKNHETHVSNSPEETIAIFEGIAKRFRSYYGYTPVLFTFEGEMGAGKTQAIKGLAKGLGIDEPVSSPTYVLAQEYTFLNEEQVVVFLHIDAWRLTDIKQLLEIGLTSVLEHNAVAAIEWSERFPDLTKYVPSSAKVVHIRIESGEKESQRRIALST